MLTLNIFTIINLLILSLLMGVRKVNTKANQLLAGIIALPAFTFLVNYLTALDFIRKMPVLLGLNVSFLWAPAILWYIKLMLRQEFRFNGWKLLHLLPFLVSIGYGLYLSMQPQSDIEMLANELKAYVFPWQVLALNALIMLQLISYLVYCLRLVIKSKSDNSSDDLQRQKWRWLYQFLVMLLVLSCLLVLGNVFFSPAENDYFVAPVLYDIFYFWVMYKCFSASGVFADFTYNINIKEEVISKGKYQASALSPSQLDTYSEQLLLHIDSHQPYTNPELSINQLAEATGIPVHHLSQLINTRFSQNFFDFINGYRVDRSKLLMKDGENNHLTLEAIGAASGFGSATAFYRAFKKREGITPSAYLKS